MFSVFLEYQLLGECGSILRGCGGPKSKLPPGHGVGTAAGVLHDVWTCACGHGGIHNAIHTVDGRLFHKSKNMSHA